MSETSIHLEEVPALRVDEVLAVQALAMGYVRAQARRVHISDAEPRRHRFALYQNSGGRVGTGETDMFLAVSAGKTDFRQWSMRISFLEMALTHERRYSNYREIYEFDWYDQDYCWGTKKNIEIYNRITGSYNDPVTGKLLDVIESDISTQAYAIESADCDELCDRMLTLTSQLQSSDAA